MLLTYVPPEHKEPQDSDVVVYALNVAAQHSREIKIALYDKTLVVFIERLQYTRSRKFTMRTCGTYTEADLT